MLTETSRTADFLDIEFTNLSYERTVARIGELAQQDRFSYIVTPNVDHIVRLNDGADQGVTTAFRAAYKNAHLRLCDSRVIQLLARMSGVHLDVVTGSDLTALLFEGDHLSDRKVALIGGDSTILEGLEQRYTAIDITQHQPPMGVLQNLQARTEIVQFIEEGAFDVILFAIGAPQSEIIANQCLIAGRSRGVALCIGASIEFLLGRKERAPIWMQRARLEWAFRLWSEPRRLWRRYLLMGPRIIYLVMKSRNR